MDPYESYRFRVTWDGRVVAGVNRVSALKRSTEVVEHRDVGDRNIVKFPGRTRYEPVVLERGVTHDREFEDWARKVQSFSDSVAGLKQRIPQRELDAIRKDVVVEVLDETGRVAIGYVVRNSWVSDYQALPELDANGNAVAIESITLQHDGWERRTDVEEPEEPTA